MDKTDQSLGMEPENLHLLRDVKIWQNASKTVSTTALHWYSTTQKQHCLSAV